MKTFDFKKKDRTSLFVEHSLGSAMDFLKEAVFSEEISKKKGLLQAMDPRVKIALFAVTIIATCLLRSVAALTIMYLLSVFLAALSGAGIIRFLRRVWMFIPIFTAFAALPAIFTQDLTTAAIFVLRVATCVSLVVLVTVTTRHSQILKSLRAIGVPAIFVQVLDMTYRYIFLFIMVFEGMHQALKARLICKMRGKDGRGWVAGRIGSLFRKSVRMSEEVYMAMVARGYRGE